MLKFFLMKIGNSHFNTARLQRYCRKIGVDRVNMGCGTYWIENWLNIGLFSKNIRLQRLQKRIKKVGDRYELTFDLKKDTPFEVPIFYGTVKKLGNAYLLHFDLTHELPLQAQTIRYVYASHFIEHLRFQEGLTFLQRCYRIMTSGGIIRLTFPNLELWVKNYYENDLEFFQMYYKTFGYLHSGAELKTRGEILMHHFYNTGHKWGYDIESIQDILERAGFTHITSKAPCESSIPDIENLELRTYGRLMESLYVEAEKL